MGGRKKDERGELIEINAGKIGSHEAYWGKEGSGRVGGGGGASG